MGALRAEEADWALAVALAPHSREAFKMLQSEIERRRFRVETPMEIIEHNPDKAAEWFRDLGAEVVH